MYVNALTKKVCAPEQYGEAKKREYYQQADFHRNERRRQLRTCRTACQGERDKSE